MTDFSTQKGKKNFDSQYWRNNVELYVLSVKNISQYRLTTNGTMFSNMFSNIFSNLFITGDWISTGVNAGCVEAAIMAGMKTSKAVYGFPEVMNGEHRFEPYKNNQ